jgi:two-component system KDP operon response regulator KdpE
VDGAELLREVWGPGYGRETHYLRVFMAQLRRKLENPPGAGRRAAPTVR